MSKLARNPIRLAAPLALAAALATAASAAPSKWVGVGKSRLPATEGKLVSAGPRATLGTKSPAMRAVALDGGMHARHARLWFRYRGESETTEPLGSGIVRRQIGLKLRAQDPCNLIYVMWRTYPDDAIAVLAKRNPGQTTSKQCGNRGYADIATIPLSAARASDAAAHRLEVRTRVKASGDLVLAIVTDGRLLRRVVVPAALAGGLDGPIGVRSDNGDYLFRLAGKR
jgi:hypothetical protein